MACSIIRSNETGEIVQVLAPNGQPSILYRKALEAYSGDRESALKAWAVAYTRNYKLRYGDWESGQSITTVDQNGEPTVDTILYTSKDALETIRTSFSNWQEFQAGKHGWVPLARAEKFARMLTEKLPGMDVRIMQSAEEPNKGKLVYNTSIKQIPTTFTPKQIEEQKDRITPIIEKLVAKIPGLTYQWIKPSELKQEEHYRNIGGIRAFVRNNEIFLVEGRVLPTDAIEEVMHVFIEALRQDRPALFKGLLDNVKADPKYSEDFEIIKKWYTANVKGGVDLDVAINSEFLAKQLATAMKLELEQNPEGRPTTALGRLIQRFFDWLSELFDGKSLGPGESLQEIAAYINTKDVFLTTPIDDYLFYSIDEPIDSDANVDPDDWESMMGMLPENQRLTAQERNIEQAKREIEKYEILKASLVKLNARKEQREVVDVIIQNIKDKITALENNVKTVSVTTYKGKEDSENLELLATKVGSGFGNFFHMLLEDLQNEHMKSGKSPSTIFITDNWFNKFYEKNKELLLFKNLDLSLIQSLGIRLSSRLDNLLSEEKIILPEVSILVEDIHGTPVLGRLDLLAVDKKGNVEIIDLKTKKVDMPITSENALPLKALRIEKTAKEYKDGVDPLFSQFKKKTDADDYHIQTAIYSEMLRKLGLNVNGRTIFAVVYNREGNTKQASESTEFTLTKFAVGTLRDADFYLRDSSGQAKDNIIATQIDAAARAAFRETEVDVEEDSQTKETNKNPFALLSKESLDIIIEKLDGMAQDQIKAIEAEIKTVESNENISKDQQNILITRLRKRMSAIIPIRESIGRLNQGDESSMKVAQAVVLKTALDVFQNEIASLRERISEIDLPQTYELGNELHSRALSEAQQYISTLDTMGNYLEYFKDTVIASVADPEVRDGLANNFSNMQNQIAGVTAEYMKVTKGVVKAIIQKTIGAERFEKVFGDMRKVLGPKLAWMERKIAQIESGEASEETMGYKFVRAIGSIIGSKPSQGRLESLKEEAARMRKLMELNTLNDKTLNDYLDGVLNNPELPFYMGSTMSANTGLQMSDIIGSNVDSELIVNAMFQYMRNMTEEGRVDTLAWADDNQVDTIKNKFVEHAGGVAKANAMITEEVEIGEVFDEEGNIKESVLHRIFRDPASIEFYNTIDKYQKGLSFYRQSIKDINAKINEAATEEEKDALKAQVKELYAKQEALSAEFTEWSISETVTKIKPEILRLMRGSGQYNSRISDIYEEIHKTVLNAGGEEKLTEEEQDKIDGLEAEVSKIRQEMREQNPEQEEKAKALIENFQFVLNYNLWAKKREEIIKQNDPALLERWDLNNSDLVPTEEWFEKRARIFEQISEIKGKDPMLEDLMAKARAIKAKSKVRGKFNYKYLSPEDAADYEKLQQEIEKRREELRFDPTETLTEDEKATVKFLYEKLSTLQVEALSQSYKKERDKLYKNVENAYAIKRDLERKRDESQSVDRALLDQILDANDQYHRHEQIFADFFNKNNSSKYIVGQDIIAKRKDLKEKPNSYLYEILPADPNDMELVPNKKYSIRRLKSEAYNPEYQESFVKNRTGKGMYPLPKGVKFDATNKKFIVDPKGKYVNKAYLEMERDPVAMEFYNKWVVENFLMKQKSASGQPLGFNLPFVKQLGLENVLSKGAAGLSREYKEKIQELLYNNSKFEEATNESGMAGAMKIKFKENQRMPAELTTTNGIEAIMNWNAGYYVNRKMATVDLEMSAVLDFVNDLIKKFTAKGAAKGATGKTSEQTTAEDMVGKLNAIKNQIEYNKNKFVHGQIYEREKAPAKIFNRKNARILMQAASFARMAFDIPMQVGNLLSGNVQTFLSLSSTRHADFGDYAAAKKMVYTRWIPKMLIDYGNVSDTSFETKLLRKMNPLSQDLDKVFDANTVGKARRAANRVFDIQNLSMAIQDKGELEIGLTTMLMIMNHQRYEVFETDAQGNVVIENNVPKIKKNTDGSTVFVNAIDAHTMQNGTLVLRKDVNVTEDTISRLKGTIMTEIYRFQGNYASYTRSRFGGTLMGSIFEFYRKYLIPALTTRFSWGTHEGVHSAYSWDTDEAYMGTWIALLKTFKYYGLGTTGKTLLYDALLPGMIKRNVKLDTDVNDYYRGRAAMAAREIMAGIAAFLLYQFLRSAVMDSDDDDLSTAELMAIRALVKTTNETRSMVLFPVIGTGDDYITQLGTFTTAFKEGQTLWKLLENSFYYSSYQLTGSEFAYERGYYQRDTDRYEEGDAKVLKNLHDLSGWSNFEDAFTEQRAAAKRAVKAK